MAMTTFARESLVVAHYYNYFDLVNLEDVSRNVKTSTISDSRVDDLAEKRAEAVKARKEARDRLSEAKLLFQKAAAEQEAAAEAAVNKMVAERAALTQAVAEKKETERLARAEKAAMAEGARETKLKIPLKERPPPLVRRKPSGQEPAPVKTFSRKKVTAQVANAGIIEPVSSPGLKGNVKPKELAEILEPVKACMLQFVCASIISKIASSFPRFIIFNRI
jgi:hypothetical protein